MAQTVNGYIAKENDETPWSEVIWDSYYKTSKQFKAIIIGRRTYELMKEADEFKKIGNPFTVILSRKLSKIFTANLNFTVAKSPKEAVELLKAKNFKEALVGGGSKLNASFMKENLVDEIILDIEPLIFGIGIKLFSDSEFEAKLNLFNVQKLSDSIVRLHYKVEKQSH